MRKFLPRLLNTVAFLLCLFLILPWQSLNGFFVDFAYAKTGSTIFAGIGNFFLNYEWLKIVVIPGIILIISLIYFITAMIDKKIPKHNNSTTKPIKNAIYEPLYFFGMACAVLGMLTSLFQVKDFVITNYDWFGLGTVINNLISGTLTINRFVALIGYAVIFAAQGALALFATKNLHKRGFMGRLLMSLLFIFLAFVSYKGLTSSFDSGYVNSNEAFLRLFEGGSAIAGLSTIRTYKLDLGLNLYCILGVVLVAFILYVVIGIIRCHKNNIEMKEEKPLEVRVINEVEDTSKKKKSKEEEKVEPENSLVTQPTDVVAKDEDLFVLPAPESIIETQIEEKTVIRQLIFEKSDLDEIFNTEFEFKNCSMVRREEQTDYYVEKQKFLSISANQRNISFRLDLDSAIKLILRYPLISKDKYENHKLWFKIENIGSLNKETIIEIIKDAYNAILKNE